MLLKHTVFLQQENKVNIQWFEVRDNIIQKCQHPEEYENNTLVQRFFVLHISGYNEKTQLVTKSK